MNSDYENCYGVTGGGEYDCFNTPVDKNGFSILTGMSNSRFGNDIYFKLVGIETY